MEVTGVVKHVGETQTFESGFCKRLIVIECKDREYTNTHGFEFCKTGTSKLDGIEPGDIVTIAYNLGQCREYQGKWYADLHRGWKIDVGVKKMESVADSETPF